MTSRAVLPLVGVTACLKSRDEFHFHSVGTKYVDAVVVGTGALPVLIPALADRLDPDALLDRSTASWSPAARPTSTPRTMAARPPARTTSPTRRGTPPPCR